MRQTNDSRKQLSIKVDLDVYDTLFQIAHDRTTSSSKVSINDVVNEAISEYIKKTAKKKES